MSDERISEPKVPTLDDMKAYGEKKSPYDVPTYRCGSCLDIGWETLYVERDWKKPYDTRWHTDEAIRHGSLTIRSEEYAAQNPHCYRMVRRCACRPVPQTQAEASLKNDPPANVTMFKNEPWNNQF